MVMVSGVLAVQAKSCCSYKLDTILQNVLATRACCEQNGQDGACALTPITAPGIIDAPGAYCLANNIDGTITIDAPNVFFDLNGHTIQNSTNGIVVNGDRAVVKNGMVQNMSENGILVNAQKCAFDTVSSIANKNGFLFDHAYENYLQGCAALQNTSAGFSFVSSSTNYAFRCRAIGTQGTGDTYGFIATAGSDNVFESCMVDATRTSSGSCIVDVPGYVNTTAGGFVLAGETGSKIWLSEAAGTSGSFDGKNNAYGILLSDITGPTPTFNALTQVASAGGIVNLLDVAWVSWNEKRYVAVATGGPALIYEFDPATFSFLLKQSNFSVGQTSAIAWLVCDNKLYLAVGVQGTTGLFVYTFDPVSSTITLVATSMATPQSVNSVAWLVQNGKKYLAAGYSASGGAVPEVQVFEFDDSSLSFVVQINLTSSNVATKIAWLFCDGHNYLAAALRGGAASIVHILDFDPMTLALSSIASQSITTNPFAVAWLIQNDKKFFAVGKQASVSDPSTVKIFEFDPLSTPKIKLVDQTVTSNPVWSVAWLMCDNASYLAVADRVSPTSDSGTINIFSFDPLSTSSLSGSLAHADIGEASVAWTQYGNKNFLAGGGANGLTIFDFIGMGCPLTIFSHDCIIKQNIVHGTTGGASLAQCGNGVGIKADSTQNYIAENLSCHNDVNYQDVETKYLASQENARGVYNIDCSRTEPDEINLIESKLDLLISSLIQPA